MSSTMRNATNQMPTNLMKIQEVAEAEHALNNQIHH